MLIETWTQVLNDSFQNLFYGLVEFIPNLLVAVLIFIVGWLIGAGLSRIVAQLVNSLKVNNALRSAGVDGITKRAGVDLDAGAFLGSLVKWFFIVVFLVASLDVLGLTEVNSFLRDVVLGYLPQVIVAVLVLLIAAVVADMAQNIVAASARAAHMRSAAFLGTITRWSIWIFAILAALDHLQVASAFVQTLFTGIVVAVSLAVGLAFGLGGQDAAARYIDQAKKNMED
tara:strand:- start:871 stop:1554 length:684 start_codon:yes stop_codon:yes gene_type:complete